MAEWMRGMDSRSLRVGVREASRLLGGFVLNADSLLTCGMTQLPGLDQARPSNGSSCPVGALLALLRTGPLRSLTYSLIDKKSTRP